MSEDRLIERLRLMSVNCQELWEREVLTQPTDYWARLFADAADEIERLRAAVPSAPKGEHPHG